MLLSGGFSMQMNKNPPSHDILMPTENKSKARYVSQKEKSMFGIPLKGLIRV